MQERFRYKGDGTVEVHRCINDVHWNHFQGPADVFKDGELKKEGMPAWMRKAIGIIWQEVLEDAESSNVYTKSIMWRSTDFLRHVVSEKPGRGVRSRPFVITASCSQ